MNDTGDKKPVDKLPFRHRQRREEIKTLATLNDDPEWWPEQLEKLRDEDTLETLALKLSVKFGVYRNWILGDTKREKQYVEAVLERKRRLMEKVEERLYQTALNPTGWPKHADSLRAAEILRNPPAALSAGVQTASPSINIVFVSAQDGKPVPAVEQGVTVDHVP